MDRPGSGRSRSKTSRRRQGAKRQARKRFLPKRRRCPEVEAGRRPKAGRMFAHPLRLEFIARSGDLTQSMRVFQNDARRQGSDGDLNSPTIHRLKLRLSAWKLNRHGIVHILGRHHMVVYVDTPAFIHNPGPEPRSMVESGSIKWFGHCGKPIDCAPLCQYE